MSLDESMELVARSLFEHPTHAGAAELARLMQRLEDEPISIRLSQVGVYRPDREDESWRWLRWIVSLGSEPWTELFVSVMVVGSLGIVEYRYLNQEGRPGGRRRLAECRATAEACYLAGDFPEGVVCVWVLPSGRELHLPWP